MSVYLVLCPEASRCVLSVERGSGASNLCGNHCAFDAGRKHDTPQVRRDSNGNVDKRALLQVSACTTHAKETQKEEDAGTQKTGISFIQPP